MAGAQNVEAAVAEVSRRQRKKDATRRLLIDSALQLFQERGYESVTVADIAEAADVDASTFFRLFGAKENVLFDDSDELVEVARSSLVGRPRDEPLAQSLSAALNDLRTALGANTELEALRIELGSESGRLRSRYLTQQWAIAETVRVAIEHRQNPSESHTMIAATAFVASLDWLRRHPGSSKSNAAGFKIAVNALSSLEV